MFFGQGDANTNKKGLFRVRNTTSELRVIPPERCPRQTLRQYENDSLIQNTQLYEYNKWHRRECMSFRFGENAVGSDGNDVASEEVRNENVTIINDVKATN
jgi:hypothetical protein